MYLASKSPQRKALLEALGLDFEIVLPDYDEVDEGGMLPAQLVERHSRGKALSVASRVAPLAPGRPVLGVDTMVAAHGRAVGKAHDEAAARDYLQYMSGKVHLVYSGITLVSAPRPADREREPRDREELSAKPGDPGYPHAAPLIRHPGRSEGSRPESDPGHHGRSPYSGPGERTDDDREFDDSPSGSASLACFDDDPDETDPPDDGHLPDDSNVEEVEVAGQNLELRTASLSTEVHFALLTDADIDAYIATGEWRERAGAYAIQGRASAFVEEVHGDYTNIVGLPVSLLVEMLREIGLWPPAGWSAA
ncbi:MAG: Maf family protein [Thermoleophilia bacterium]